MYFEVEYIFYRLFNSLSVCCCCWVFQLHFIIDCLIQIHFTYYNWLNLYSFSVEYGSYPEYLLEWQRFIRDNPDFPILIVYYEDLKKVNSLNVWRKLPFMIPRILTIETFSIAHAYLLALYFQWHFCWKFLI